MGPLFSSRPQHLTEELLKQQRSNVKQQCYTTTDKYRHHAGASLAFRCHCESAAFLTGIGAIDLSPLVSVCSCV